MVRNEGGCQVASLSIVNYRKISFSLFSAKTPGYEIVQALHSDHSKARKTELK